MANDIVGGDAAVDNWPSPYTKVQDKLREADRRAWSDAALTGEAGVRIETGIPFGGREVQGLLGDLYRPAPSVPGPYPTVLLIHGGAFHVGARSSLEHWGRLFAREGFAAFSIDYTLATPDRPTFPLAVNEARVAVRFLHDRANDLELDGARLASMGCSAGATIAATLALTTEARDGSGGLADIVDGASWDRVDTAIVVCGAYDLIATWEHDRLSRFVDGHTQGYLGGTPMDARRRYYDASPLTHASRQNAAGTRWLISWGTNDDVAPPERQSLVFANHLTRAGATVRLAPIVGAAHFWYLEGRNGQIDPLGSTFNGRLAERVLTFLRDWCGW